jgi:hypothetical protein
MTNNKNLQTANVELLRENPDGSAVYTFEFSQEHQEALLRLGIMRALELGIEEAKQYHPDYQTEKPKEKSKEWVGLTDEELLEAEDTGEKSYRRWKSSIRGNMVMPQDSLQWHISRAIEAKLIQKNT